MGPPPARWGFLLLGGSIIAQDRSIRFETLSFQEALDKAKAGNRLLFVDCYTAWCGPCKMLAKDVFTKNEVADYFNEHFVSLKVDCEKGEGPELAKRFGVNSYPTLLFINGEGKVVNKILGASRPDIFLEKVKKGLDPNNSLSAKEKRYESGERARAFVLDLIASYSKVRNTKKATQVSLELLSSLEEKEMLTREIWEVIRNYYVSTYGSKWWDFILEHSDEYAALVGKEAVAAKIGETLHPYLFGYACGKYKAENKSDFKVYKNLIDKYQPQQKKVLYEFVELGRSASFDGFNGYFKTVMKMVPKMNKSEHYRFFTNALDLLVDQANARQKQQLLAVLEESQSLQTDYFKPLYQKFFDKVKQE